MNWKRTSHTLSLCAAGIGAVGLLGWMTGVETLKRIHPAWVTMKPNTALCLMLGGMAIALLRDEKLSGLRRAMVRGAAGVLICVGLVTFGQHVDWWNSGIDELLFKETQESAGKSFPGRMGPVSAGNFVLLGAAILLLDTQRRSAITSAQSCAAGVIALTFLIFLAYFYEVEMPRELEMYLSIAFHTVIAFLLLAAAVLLARPEVGIMSVFLADRVSGRVARRMLPAAIILPGFLGWLCMVGKNAGLYGRGVATALLAGALTVVFTSLVWWAARALAMSDLRRESVQHTLQHREREMAAIVDSSSDAIISKNLNSIVTSWNKGAERLFGYTSEEMVGQSITKLIPPWLQHEEEEILRRLRAGEEIEHYETVRVRKSGDTVDVSLSISPMRDERGIIVGASKIARDISLRKQADAALAQARDEAEAANRAKDDFLAVLSHELRTPLTPALAAASSLQSLPKLDEADLRETLAIIRRNIELEAKLVDDLLDVTRITRGKLGLQTAPVDLHLVLNDAVRMVEAAAKGKGINLVLEFTAGDVLVRGDVVRLTQVFANLLANAVKFTPEEGRVTVRTSRHGGGVRIDVEDTGIGIAREEIRRIFDPFRQGAVGTSRRYGGLGLGLSVAKGFVQAHGGTIRADSEGQGRGATFTVELPEISDAAAPPSTRAEPRPTSERTALLRVLLVEDHADTRSVLQRMIAQVGHTVTGVGSVAEARRAIAEGNYDVMLCDLGLPDGTGIDVIGELRRKSNIPAIAMSGYGMDADLARSRAAGFQRHIVKPMVADALLEMLEDCAALADRQTGGRP